MVGFSEKEKTSPAFSASSSSSRCSVKARDDSPDSVIITPLHKNSSSLFSSSASTSAADRCSFGPSDFQQHHTPPPLFSHFSKQEPEPDLDLNNTCSSPSLQVQQNKKSNSDKAEDNPINYSFSVALKECQDNRVKSDDARIGSEEEEEDKSSSASASAAVKKHVRRRRRRGSSVSLSLDLNGGGDVSSPRTGIIMNTTTTTTTTTITSSHQHQKSSCASHRSGTFPSPVTPSSFRNKGWSSERVPLPAASANYNRRYTSLAPGLSLNGKALPSKWEDAEKWIFSPVVGDAINKPWLPPRRPKSKSGPLAGPSGPCTSPSMPNYYNGGRVHNCIQSPFSPGVPVAETCFVQVGSSNTEACIIRSASVHGWSDLVIPPALPISQDEQIEGTKDASTMISPAVSRRDMATQMSPEGSATSSPKQRPSLSKNPAQLTELQVRHSSKLEVRDVQVDDRIAMNRRSKKQSSRAEKGSGPSMEVGEWKKKSVEARASAWEVAETAKCVSKFKREEAKITAWENLQKAKAEAEIRKLEMKLEKMRSSSMDKIMNKLRSAHRKAQEMRISVSASQADKVAKTFSKAAKFRKSGQIVSLSGCFTCHAS